MCDVWTGSKADTGGGGQLFFHGADRNGVGETLKVEHVNSVVEVRQDHSEW